MKELAKKYEHQLVEKDIYDKWIEKGYFSSGDLSKEPYCIVIPPPNVTGKLHMGHAMDNTLQDIVSRYRRMQGFDMLWLPGMDHAGIATQAKIDARLKDEGISRYDLGREGFLERAWEWKEEYANHIHDQWKKLGNSVDYSKERFTLDDGLSDAVKEVFVRLYNEGLIYRGERIINWDPIAKTALSNIEVIHKEVEGAMYTFKYMVEETGEELHVSTTRPETMFGDVCVVVHPDDNRYKHLVGKHAINPANHESLVIITDEYIDIEFGTGAMKCTPAHDPNDFIIGEKNGFLKPICIEPDGKMNELAGEHVGLDRFDCRSKLVDRIKKEGNLVSIEKHIHQVGHSERTDAIVEPYLSKQWFVKMQPLAKDVLDAQEKSEEKIVFFPARFEKVFTGWLENIEDWCISRQLWWGHRIPAWYHKETNEVYVGLTPPSDIENWNQDEDVLDTWFSSALWPFSTLGWPEETPDFQRYYPNQLMITAYDIILFWVTRMAFQGLHLTGKLPFKEVLIHGLIRDEQGRKMSKSLGNGIDPIDEIEKYGTDALRYFLATSSTPGQDFSYNKIKVEAAWNFINKIWNASRFVMMNLGEFTLEDMSFENLEDVDKWIIAKMNTAVGDIVPNMEKYEFALVGSQLYNFVWDDFCSWYIELSKVNVNSEDEKAVIATKSTLLLVLTNILKMLHPFIPFVTEEIYQSLPHMKESICIESYPEVFKLVDSSSKVDVERLISIVQIVREIKVDYNLKPATELNVAILDADGNTEVVDEYLSAMMQKICKAKWCLLEDGEKLVRPILAGSLQVAMNDIVDTEEEKKKLSKEIEYLGKEISRAEGMLANDSFISKAPAQKIEEEKAKLEKYKIQLEIAMNQLSKM